MRRHFEQSEYLKNLKIFVAELELSTSLRLHAEADYRRTEHLSKDDQALNSDEIE